MNTREQVEAAHADQHVLQRQHDEERQDQAAVVAAPRVRQRDELAQREEREHAEQQRRAQRRPRAQASQNTDGADPQRAQVAPQTVCAARWSLCCARSVRRTRRCRPARQQRRTASGTAARSAGRRRARAALHRLHGAPSPRERALGAARRRITRGPRSTAARARGRRACPRPASSCIGAPKVTVHRIGTGTTSPLGITRCTLSIHAGISCTPGNCSARWYSPLLNGSGSPLLLRVPSGKITSESPLLQRLGQRFERVLGRRWTALRACG